MSGIVICEICGSQLLEGNHWCCRSVLVDARLVDSNRGVTDREKALTEERARYKAALERIAKANPDG